MRRRILLYIYALTDGGAERVIATLASGLADRGHDVVLATDYPPQQASPAVSSKVRVLELGASHAGSIVRLSRLLRTVDVSISGLGVSNLKHAVAALLAGRIDRAVLSFHGHLESEAGGLSRIGNRLAPVLTRLAGRSVFVSDALLADFARRGISRAKAVRIHNPVDIRFTCAAIAGPSHPHILGVGRLVPLKRFDRLIRSFARLDHPEARLTILGDGPERATLQALVATLGLGDRVALVGWTAEPAAYYAAATCFVLCSARESFSNVVVEALGHGLPVVATDCGGPREILADGAFGRLVPVDDEAALTDAIRATLADPGDPALRRARAAAFSSEAALDAYEHAIDQVLGAA